MFGRTKPDSIEFVGARLPTDAHIARVQIDDDAGEEVQIYRRSVPYGTTREHGINFLAFGADRDRFDRMLARMFGPNDDGAPRPPGRLLAAGQRRLLLRAVAVTLLATLAGRP